MTVPVQAVFSNSLEASDAAPADIQYMPPGRHRINATRNGRPAALEIIVDAQTAQTLDAFLQAQLAKADSGSEDRPYFDFNHEDREASAWPTQFYWAGDDPKTGGVRAKVEWTGAGEKAVSEKTFRRFSPTFVPDDSGRVVGSTTNMGGLVNRAAFKTIQPLFARQVSEGDPNIACGEPVESVRDPSETFEPMNELIDTLKNVGLVNAASSQTDPASASLEVKASVSSLRGKLQELETLNDALEAKLAETENARLAAILDEAVFAGRVAPSDEDAKAFWTEALRRDETKAVKALQSLPVNPVLAQVTSGQDAKTGALDKMAQQQKKLAEIQAAHPGAPFETIFAKAQTQSPDLFQ